MTTVRLLRVQVLFDACTDDGENLTPLERREAAVAPGDLDRIPTLVRDAVADIEKQLNAEKGDQS